MRLMSIVMRNARSNRVNWRALRRALRRDLVAMVVAGGTVVRA